MLPFRLTSHRNGYDHARQNRDGYKSHTYPDGHGLLEKQLFTQLEAQILAAWPLLSRALAVHISAVQGLARMHKDSGLAVDD